MAYVLGLYGGELYSMEVHVGHLASGHAHLGGFRAAACQGHSIAAVDDDACWQAPQC
jgi:hypothetical protein